MCRCKEISTNVRAGMEALNQGRPQDGLVKLQAALKQAQEFGSPIHQAKIRNNMALAFQDLGLPDQARKNYALALHLVAARVGSDNYLYRSISRNLDTLEDSIQTIFRAQRA